MSEIDRSLSPELRDELLSEVRGFLPAFLGAAVNERDNPVAAAAELLGLSLRDLRRVLAVHALLSEPVRSFVAALPEGVRRPIMASTRPRVAGRVVTSGIDWAGTIRHRATSSPTNPEWVTRPARRIFDLPENRALAWLIEELRGRVASLRVPSTQSASWIREVQQAGATVAKAQKLAWLEGIPAEWPGDHVYERLRADRSGFYRTRVAPAARYLRRLLYLPTVQDIVDAICTRYFEPSQDWKLYEVAVLLRISRALAEVGTRRGAVRMLDVSNQPFVTYEVSDDRLVSIWYQGWPPSSGESELRDAITYYGTGEGGNRPDVVVEIRVGGRATRLIVLELKASYAPAYLSSGFAQLLSYLRDRPTLTRAPASGWLVAPYRDHAALDPGSRALWLVSADSAAEAIVDAVREAIGAAP